jgi:hypothetical protein
MDRVEMSSREGQNSFASALAPVRNVAHNCAFGPTVATRNHPKLLSRCVNPRTVQSRYRTPDDHFHFNISRQFSQWTSIELEPIIVMIFIFPSVLYLLHNKCSACRNSQRAEMSRRRATWVCPNIRGDSIVGTMVLYLYYSVRRLFVSPL